MGGVEPDRNQSDHAGDDDDPDDAVPTGSGAKRRNEDRGRTERGTKAGAVERGHGDIQGSRSDGEVARLERQSLEEELDAELSLVLEPDPDDELSELEEEDDDESFPEEPLEAEPWSFL